MNQVANTVMITADEYNVMKTAVLQCDMKLQACQAREKALRDALKTAQETTYSDKLSDEWLDLLAQPTDDTALKQLLAAEREKERGRIAKMCDQYAWGIGGVAANIAKAIRNLGDE